MAPTTKPVQLKKTRNRRSNRKQKKNHGQNVEMNVPKIIGQGKSKSKANNEKRKNEKIVGIEKTKIKKKKNKKVVGIVEQKNKSEKTIAKKTNEKVVGTVEKKNKRKKKKIEKKTNQKVVGIEEQKKKIEKKKNKTVVGIKEKKKIHEEIGTSNEKTMKNMTKYKIFKTNKRVFINQRGTIWDIIGLPTEALIQEIVGEDLLEDLRKSEKGYERLAQFVYEFKSIFWNFRGDLEDFKSVLAAVGHMLKLGECLGFDAAIFEEFFTCPTKQFLPVIGISRTTHSFNLHTFFHKLLEGIPEKWRKFGENIDRNTFRLLMLALFNILVESVIGIINTIMKFESHSKLFTGCSLVFHGPNKTKSQSKIQAPKRTHPMPPIPIETISVAVTSQDLPQIQHQNDYTPQEELQAYRGIWTSDFGGPWGSNVGFEEDEEEKFEKKSVLKNEFSTKNPELLAQPVLTEKNYNSVENNSNLRPNSESIDIKREMCALNSFFSKF
ncbi:unnamed protein product [Caenorhabditis angaria]|uniref:Uncharacterized protein n=1 Tax=Caenorhabditis angaria TaxID=860376 RepID=A0A9P1J132_9PELO|nr:unnamed protein product [Caenorhabditis angaria]